MPGCPRVGESSFVPQFQSVLKQNALHAAWTECTRLAMTEIGINICELLKKRNGKNSGVVNVVGQFRIMVCPFKRGTIFSSLTEHWNLLALGWDCHHFLFKCEGAGQIAQARCCFSLALFIEVLRLSVKFLLVWSLDLCLLIFDGWKWQIRKPVKSGNCMIRQDFKVCSFSYWGNPTW